MKDFNIFETLEKDDKELIHSSFVCFLMNEYKEFYSSVLGLDYSSEILSQIDAKVEQSLGKEYGRADILVREPMTILIENKFKSFPNNDQLAKYDEKFPNSPNVHKYLLTFDKSIVNLSPDIRDNWKIIDYKQILEFCKSVIKTDLLSNDKRLFIEHYVLFISSYIADFHKLNSDSSFINEKINSTDRNSTFWKVIIFNLIKLKTEQILDYDNYGIHVFAGSQKTPGLYIWTKNPERYIFKNVGSVWFELQDKKLRLKLGKQGISQRNELADILNKSGINLDLTGFVRKPSENANSFTLYQENLEITTVENIAQQLVNFKNKFEDILLNNR